MSAPTFNISQLTQAELEYECRIRGVSSDAANALAEVQAAWDNPNSEQNVILPNTEDEWTTERATAAQTAEAFIKWTDDLDELPVEVRCRAQHHINRLKRLPGEPNRAVQRHLANLLSIQGSVSFEPTMNSTVVEENSDPNQNGQHHVDSPPTATDHDTANGVNETTHNRIPPSNSPRALPPINTNPVTTTATVTSSTISQPRRSQSVPNNWTDREHQVNQ